MLTDWMSTHARVTWLANETPWLVEDELIKYGPRLPLNIRGSNDPFAAELKKLRAQAWEDATDPGRFVGDAGDIKMLSKGRTVDHLTDEERAQNAEHDRIVEQATKGLREN